MKRKSGGVTRRQLLIGTGAIGLTAVASRVFEQMIRARKAPAILRDFTLTVSTWGGVTQDSIKTFVQPEFEKQTGATLAYDIGGQGARTNKLLAQRVDPPADIFFSTDEAVVAGYKAGILTPARRQFVPNATQLEDWSHTVENFNTDTTLPGIPYTLIAYVLAYNPESVKEKPTSWGDMWRPEFLGKLAFASPVHTQMPAFVIVASELAGGSVSNVDPGFKKLAELKPIKLTVFWTDWAPLDKTGDATLATEFDYYLETMKNDKYPIDYVIPKEKGFASPEYASIVKGTKNQEIAEVFLNLLIDAKIQESFAINTYQTPVNKTVKLTGAQIARCGCGASVEQLRFFDPALFFEKRPLWTERMNTEVVPNWRV
ncbi:MAG: ABC transporter substrate-binding protein [Candidatus Acidiferrales bacterium]